MNKLFIILFTLTFGAVCVFPQQTGEFNRNEGYVGYSNQQINEGERGSFNGFEVSYVRNVSRYFGIKGDFSAAFLNKSASAPGVSIKFDRSVYDFLGGVQIKDNASEKRLKPFAHFLAGVGHTKLKRTCPVCFDILPDIETSDTGFAAAVGGGLDIRINRRIDLRAFQVDYNPIRAYGRLNNNVRLGVGLVFK